MNFELAASGAKARSNAESECQHNNEEAEHQQGCVNQADSLPTAEPSLAGPAKSVHGAPEAMREVEPQSSQPNDVEDYIDRTTESLLNVAEAVGRIA